MGSGEIQGVDIYVKQDRDSWIPGVELKSPMFRSTSKKLLDVTFVIFLESPLLFWLLKLNRKDSVQRVLERNPL